MLRALQIFTACLASFPFLVSPPRSIPLKTPGTPSKDQPSEVPFRSTFPSTNLNLLAPWNAGFSRPTTSFRLSPYEGCPASFHQCQT